MTPTCDTYWLWDVHNIKQAHDDLGFRGVNGTTGTQASLFPASLGIPKATTQHTAHGHYDLSMGSVKKGQGQKRTHGCIRVSCSPCVCDGVSPMRSAGAYQVEHLDPNECARGHAYFDPLCISVTHGSVTYYMTDGTGSVTESFLDVLPMVAYH